MEKMATCTHLSILICESQFSFGSEEPGITWSTVATMSHAIAIRMGKVLIKNFFVQSKRSIAGYGYGPRLVFVSFVVLCVLCDPFSFEIIRITKNTKNTKNHEGHNDQEIPRMKSAYSFELRY